MSYVDHFLINHRGAEEIGERGVGKKQGSKGEITNAQCPMPNAQCPMPNAP
ncbi:MAG: hypothetical protein V7L05_19805 [Nostoc sp.]|uniref:hypothetical protein n=1 Tax=Nostoc sp. TaxID=1180 RepID=UPI002FFD019D